jgi:cell wall-associated NlpC family hydrolase
VKRFTATLVVALLGLSAVAVRSADADPVSAKKAEAARIAAQLEESGRVAEVLTEQYNAAQIKAGTTEAEAKKAAAALAEADNAVARAQSVLKETAVQAYVHGGFVPLSGQAASPKDALELTIRRKYINVVADRQTDALHALRNARDDAATRRAELEQATQASRQALAAAEAKRKAAASAVDAQKALLSKVKGELAALVAAEQRRKAEEEARRVQAALAARQASARNTVTPSGGGGPVTLNRSIGTAPTNPPPPPNAGAAAAVAEAKRQLGKPYQWGGAGPDTFDCSGLTAWAWKAAGKTLSHYTGSQWNETARVEIKDLQPGDLVFFGSDLHHVGIYVGNGQMIHAPQTGDVVKYDTIYRSDLVPQGGRVY